MASSPASSQYPPQVGHASTSTRRFALKKCRWSFTPGQRGHSRLRDGSKANRSLRWMCSSGSPAASSCSSTFCSSKASNQIPPQPPWQTSTTREPTCNWVSSLKQAGHFIFLQQEPLHPIQVVSVDQVNTVGLHFTPECRFIRRTPEADAPALLMGLSHDLIEFKLVRLGNGACPSPFEVRRPISTDPRDEVCG